MTHALSSCLILCRRIKVYTQKSRRHREVVQGGVWGQEGVINIPGGAQLHLLWIDQGKYISYCVKVVGTRASGLHGKQGEAPGPRSGKGGPGKGTDE